MEIDQEILISLVRDQPVIWDNTIVDYKNKRLKYNAWKDICKKLKPGLDDLNSDRKIEFEKLVIKKWTNMKDNWIKYRRKINGRKSGVKNSRKYLYYDKMMFLKKLIEHRKTGDYSMSQGDSNDDASQNGDNVEDYINRTNRECESPKLKEAKKVELTEWYDNSRSMNFFKGIAPTVDKFNDETMIEFQFQVISVIKDIKQRERTENTAQFNQGTHAQFQDCTSSSNMNPQIYGCRSKCQRTSTYDPGQQSSFRQSATNRSHSQSVKVPNDDSKEHSDVDHVWYFDLPPKDVGAHLMDTIGLETEETVIKIEIVKDSMGPEDTPDEPHSDQINDL